MLRHGYAWHGPLPDSRYFFATLNLERKTLNPERQRLLAGALIVLAALAAYHNSFSGPFIFDDPSAITNNPSIKHFGSALSLHGSITTSGRPLLNLTFAFNYALGGMNVWGYHAFNLLVHTLAGLTLFGVVRRTLLRQGYGGQALASRLAARRSLPRQSRHQTISDLKPEISQPPLEPTWLALTVAVIWTVHPIQTEAVTYISQRAESLMGLFYLLTLYCFLRSVEKRYQVSGVRCQEAEDQKSDSQLPALNPRRSVPNAQLSTLNSQLSIPALQSFSSSMSSEARRAKEEVLWWRLASIFCCLLGSMTKENIVTAPVMVLLYDRTFVAGSFRAAWQQRRKLYLGLAAAWLLLACMMHLNEQGVGFNQGLTWWTYALTSCRSVALYLKLAVWPHPLVFDYGTNIIRHVSIALPYALVPLVLFVAVVIALRYWPAVGFVGAWFFVILAPTSSVVPVAFQPVAEHRLYLSLAAVVVLVVLGLYRLIGRRSLLVCAAVAVGLGWLTVQRNKDYKSELTLWSDNVAKCPNNERAHESLGNALIKVPGRMSDAITEFQTALRINPDNADAHTNLGNILLNVPGQLPEAIAECEAALRLKPDYAVAHNDLGNALSLIPGRLPDAIAQFQAALRINPDYLEAHTNLGNALISMPGRLSDAIAQYEAALRINPDYADAHNGLGSALLKLPGRLSEAIDQYEEALRINPNSADAHFNLGNTLAQMPGRLPEAIAQYEAALQINPDSAETHANLGDALLKIPGRLFDAIAEFQSALRLKPDYAEAHNNLGNALLLVPDRAPDAVAEYETALRLKPDYAEAHYNLGNAFFQSDRFTEALGEYQNAVQLKPDYAEAHNNLGNTLAELGRLPEAIEQYKLALQINPDYMNARQDMEQVQKAMALIQHPTSNAQLPTSKSE